MRGNLTAADLFVDGFAAAALSMAETAFPVLEPFRVVEEAPLSKAPALPEVPRSTTARKGGDCGGLGASALLLALGIMVLRGTR
jgi:hypothetical protein